MPQSVIHFVFLH